MPTSTSYDELTDWLLDAMNADAERYPNTPRSTEDEDWSNGGLAVIIPPGFEDETP